MIGKYKIIAMCTSRIRDKECYGLVRELNNLICKTDMRLFVFNADIKDEGGSFRSNGSTDIFEFLKLSSIDLVLVDEEHIGSPVVSEKLIEAALDMGRPVVVIGEEHNGCLNVRFNENGFGDIVRHMITVHGCTSLHMMAGLKDNVFSDSRIEVFKDVLEEYNMPFNDSMVSYGGFWAQPAMEATEALIKSGNLPKAVICANDNMAIAVIGVLKNHGYRIPEDIAVTGYDNSDEAYFCEPQLTTVARDNAVFSKRLIEIFGLAFDGVTGTEDVNTKMICHCSCGCDTSDNNSSVEYIVDVNNQFLRYQEEGIDLSEIGAQIQLCSNFEEISYLMHRDDKMYAMSCMLKRECIDCSLNPAKDYEHKFADEILLLFDSDCINYEQMQNKHFSPHLMNSSDILPSLDYYLDDGRCIIFNLLCYHGVSLGYLAFHYSEYGDSNFFKIPQTVTVLNNALGSFCNSRYQDYLMNRIDEMYRTDALTGLLNRHGFIVDYKKLLNEVKGIPFTVALLDLDGLKYINDNFGHEEGDYAIRTAAEALKYSCPDNAVCTRFGGDEMLAVFPECDYDVREKLNSKLDETNLISGKPYKVLGSMGILKLSSGDYPQMEELIRRTDKLMYEEKCRRKSVCK